MIFFRCCASLIFISLLFIALSAMAAEPTAQDMERITTQLRCLTCPNENIAESNTPMALDVKRYIYERLNAGETADTIITTLTARYGEELRYKPVWAQHTLLLWLMPLICLSVGGLIMMHIFRRKT